MQYRGDIFACEAATYFPVKWGSKSKGEKFCHASSLTHKLRQKLYWRPLKMYCCEFSYLNFLSENFPSEASKRTQVLQHITRQLAKWLHAWIFGHQLQTMHLNDSPLKLFANPCLEVLGQTLHAYIVLIIHQRPYTSQVLWTSAVHKQQPHLWCHNFLKD